MRYGQCGSGRMRMPGPIAMMMMADGRIGADWMFDGPGFGRGRGRWGYGGPGRRRMFAGGELRLLLLKLIADQSRHGYDLIRAIEAMSGGRYAPSPGVVYPTLALMVDEDVIVEQPSDGTRKAFAVTAAGEAELADKADEVAALIARLTDMAREADLHGAPPIGRAVGNLFAAMRDRLAGEQVDRELLHRIAAILDEAAQRIERL